MSEVIVSVVAINEQISGELVAELVRCRDCKHYRKDTCSAWAGIAYPPPDDWFCADGIRKE